MERENRAQTAIGPRIVGILGSVRPGELLVTSFMRARLCEALASHVGAGAKSFDYFLLGMFSLLDALLGCPIGEAIALLPLSDDIAAALRGQPNDARRVLNLVCAYEKGEWERFSELAAEVDLPHSCMPDLYCEAVQAAERVYSPETVGPPVVTSE